MLKLMTFITVALMVQRLHFFYINEFFVNNFFLVDAKLLCS